MTERDLDQKLERLRRQLDRAYSQRALWESSYNVTGSYSALCNMEAAEERIERLEAERLKLEGAIA